ncbi:MAG: Gfo/Idh/MocA family oxidoreductase [Planctomycetales bacterium]|nr:Gfo/Idh/MocA family oxidoreductase [Planctomycetales bacterium]
MSNSIRWGIMGAGFIAAEFTHDLHLAKGATCHAVASRSGDRARDFAQRHRIPHSCATYESLVSRDDIDVVYVATPHTRHRDHCLMAIQAGKHVVCEKPFTINAAEAEEVAQAAREHKRFCMEAMWMRFMPLVQTLHTAVQRGELGTICAFSAEFGVPHIVDPGNRLFCAELGGGAWLDRGVYGVSLAHYLFGVPIATFGSAIIGETGVDESCTATMQYEGGLGATITCSIRSWLANTASIAGTQGNAVLQNPFYRPHRLTRTGTTPIVAPAAAERPGLKQRLKDNRLLRGMKNRLEGLVGPLRNRGNSRLCTIAGKGYLYEIDEVVRCLREGKLESEFMSLDESIAVMRTLDAVRARWT